MTNGSENEPSKFDKLEDTIWSVFREYKEKFSFFGNDVLPERHIHNLVDRISEAVRSYLGDEQEAYVAHLEDQVEQLEEELDLAKGPNYEGLREDYESMRALVKHLIYMLDEDESELKISTEDLREKMRSVEMLFEYEHDGQVLSIKTREYED
jgi:hypothetical protein